MKIIIIIKQAMTFYIVGNTLHVLASIVPNFDGSHFQRCDAFHSFHHPFMITCTTIRCAILTWTSPGSVILRGVRGLGGAEPVSSAAEEITSRMHEHRPFEYRIGLRLLSMLKGRLHVHQNST